MLRAPSPLLGGPIIAHKIIIITPIQAIALPKGENVNNKNSIFVMFKLLKGYYKNEKSPSRIQIEGDSHRNINLKASFKIYEDKIKNYTLYSTYNLY